MSLSFYSAGIKSIEILSYIADSNRVASLCISDEFLCFISNSNVYPCCSFQYYLVSVVSRQSVQRPNVHFSRK